MYTDLQDTRAKRRKAATEARKILDEAESEGRKLRPDEERRFDRIMADCDKQAGEIRDLEDTSDRRGMVNQLVYENQPDAIKPGIETGAEPREMRDVKGNEYRLYRPEDEMPDTSDFNLGRFVRAAIHPEFAQDCSDSEQRALQVGSDTTGGYTVSAINGGIMSPLRKATTVGQNCNIIKFKNLQPLTIIGLDTEADSVEAKRELSTISESNISFQKLELRPHLVGTWVPISKELSYAELAVDLINDTLNFKLGEEIDRLCLYGAGGDECTGVTATTGIYSNTAIGALDFDTLVAEIYDLKGSNVPGPYQNFYPTAVGLMLEQLQSATDKLYVTDRGLPKAWYDLQKHETNIAESGDMVIGNFRKFGYLALHDKYEIYIGQSAYDSSSSFNAFTDVGLGIRIHTWMDFVVGNALGFQWLDGITSITIP